VCRARRGDVRAGTAVQTVRCPRDRVGRAFSSPPTRRCTIGGFRCAELQTRGEFIRSDAGLQLAVFASFGGVLRLSIWRNSRLFCSEAFDVALRRKKIGDGWLFGIGGEDRALMNRGQKARAPVENTAGWQAARIRQHDESGQVIAEAAEAIRDPCAHAREAGQDVAAVRHEHRGAVQRCLALHRVDEGHVIDLCGEFGKQIAHPAPALAMLAEFPPDFPGRRPASKQRTSACHRDRRVCPAASPVPVCSPRYRRARDHPGRRSGSPPSPSPHDVRFARRERIRRGLRILFQHGGERHAAKTAAESVEEVAT
jgi:hypothetical protein